MIWKCWDEDAALRYFSPHAVYTAVLSDSPGTTKDIISLVMQQLEIAGNLCHSFLSSSYKNWGFLEPVTQRNRRLVQDTLSSCGLFAALAEMSDVALGCRQRCRALPRLCAHPPMGWRCCTVGGGDPPPENCSQTPSLTFPFLGLTLAFCRG